MAKPAGERGFWTSLALTWFVWILTFVPSYLGAVGYSTSVDESLRAERFMAFAIGFGLVLFVTSGAVGAALHLLGFRRAIETTAALFALQLICGSLVPVLLYGAVFAFPVLPFAARVIALQVETSGAAIRLSGLWPSAVGAWVILLGLAGGAARWPNGQRTYLWNASGFELYSWAVAAVLAIVVMLAPAFAAVRWISGQVDRLAAASLAFGGSFAIPVWAANEQTHRILSVVVVLAPLAATAILARATGSTEARVGVAFGFLLLHWIGLGIVLPPAVTCGYEDCYRSTLWQSALAIGLIWFGCGRLLTGRTAPFAG